jgi:tetratricopeptide (TPR) repeat protein
MSWLLSQDSKLDKTMQLFAERRFIEAEDLLKQEAIKHPNHYLIHANLGRALFAQKKNKEAIISFTRARELNVARSQVEARLAMALSLTERHFEAIKYFDISPTNLYVEPGFLRLYGHTLTKLNRIPEAIEKLYESIELDPNNASGFGLLATAVHDQGRIEEAIQVLQQAILNNPSNPSYRVNYLAFLSKVERFELLSVEVNRIMGIQIESSSLIEILANNLHIFGFENESAIMWDRFIDKYPDHVRHAAALGVCLKRQGRIAESLKYFEMELQIPDTEGRYQVNKALALQNLGRMEEAMAKYQATLDGNDNTHRMTVLNNIGYYHLEAGRLTEASQFFKQAVEVSGAKPGPLKGLGLIAIQEGRLDEAESFFSQALTINPKYTDAHLGLGQVEAKRGNLNIAISHVRNALTIEPRHQDSKDELAKLLANQ